MMDVSVLKDVPICIIFNGKVDVKPSLSEVRKCTYIGGEEGATT